jgi:hypothetical protein
VVVGGVASGLVANDALRRGVSLEFSQLGEWCSVFRPSKLQRLGFFLQSATSP